MSALLRSKHGSKADREVQRETYAPEMEFIFEQVKICRERNLDCFHLARLLFPTLWLHQSIICTELSKQGPELGRNSALPSGRKDTALPWLESSLNTPGMIVQLSHTPEHSQTPKAGRAVDKGRL